MRDRQLAKRQPNSPKRGFKRAPAKTLPYCYRPDCIFERGRDALCNIYRLRRSEWKASLALLQMSRGQT